MQTIENVIEIAAASESDAREQAAISAGGDPSEFQVVRREPLSRMPWQPKRFKFQLKRVERPTGPVNTDGRWTVDYADGSVLLTVYPPNGAGRPAMPEDLLKERREWAIATIDRGRLYTAIEKASGKPRAIAEYEVPADRAYGVLISASDMAAYLVLGAERGGGDQLSDALNALSEAGVVHGIDAERVKAAVEVWEPGRAVLVAEGTAPEAGENAEMLSTESPCSPAIQPDGSADFSASPTDETVPAGTPLLALKPVKLGHDGTTVRGGTIPTTLGVELDLQQYLGEGVELSSDGLQIAATIDGSLARGTAGKISLRPLLRIPTKVDQATGNIDFEGNVVIDADVADEMKVRATGDLTIKGVAGGAHLEAGATMVLMNGMMGHGVGEIVSHGPLQAVFLQECTVTCDASVAVSREIIDSTITAADSVAVTGTGADSGKIVGGSVQAGREILATTVGAARGKMTKLTIVPKGDTGRPSVRVRDRVYPPAMIQIGVAKWTPDRETPFSRFVESNGTIVVNPYS